MEDRYPRKVEIQKDRLKAGFDFDGPSCGQLLAFGYPIRICIIPKESRMEALWLYRPIPCMTD